MSPKSRSRKKKPQRTNKSEPDGENPPTGESGAVLRVEEFTIDYSQSIMNGLTWDTLGGIPCFTCTNVKRCGVRQPVSPVTCSAINAWLEYERIPSKERPLAPPDFWTAKNPGKRNIKLESTKP